MSASPQITTSINPLAIARLYQRDISKRGAISFKHVALDCEIGSEFLMQLQIESVLDRHQTQHTSTSNESRKPTSKHMRIVCGRERWGSHASGSQFPQRTSGNRRWMASNILLHGRSRKVLKVGHAWLRLQSASCNWQLTRVTSSKHTRIILVA